MIFVITGIYLVRSVISSGTWIKLNYTLLGYSYQSGWVLFFAIRIRLENSAQTLERRFMKMIVKIIELDRLIIDLLKSSLYHIRLHLDWFNNFNSLKFE